MVADASRALAHLDAEQLEDLAACCRALNRNLPPRAELLRQTQSAAAEMATLARVLDATRSNLNVMRRLRELRMGAAHYGEMSSQSRLPGGGSGDD